jgi:hypothetical protein
VLGGCWFAPITNRGEGGGGDGEEIADICSWVTHLMVQSSKGFDCVLEG